MMVRPWGFGFNEETAQSNHFQKPSLGQEHHRIHDLALAEFDSLRLALEKEGVAVHLFEDDAIPHTPDSVFPNNWVSFHAEGELVIYPMLAKNRQQEVRRDWIENLRSQLNGAWHREVDLTYLGEQSLFLEGTGSLALDRVSRIAYAAISDRTSRSALEAFAKELGYELHAFATQDRAGKPIYHTNVMMSVGPQYAVACIECLPDPQEQQRLRESLTRSGKELIEISLDQVEHFAGNQLALFDRDDKTLIVMSESARNSLKDSQLASLEKHGRIISVPLETIETHGGGSARCMLAELHL